MNVFYRISIIMGISTLPVILSHIISLTFLRNLALGNSGFAWDPLSILFFPLVYFIYPAVFLGVLIIGSFILLRINSNNGKEVIGFIIFSTLILLAVIFIPGIEDILNRFFGLV
mgnify:CR=1 FL=1